MRVFGQVRLWLLWLILGGSTYFYHQYAPQQTQDHVLTTYTTVIKPALLQAAGEVGSPKQFTDALDAVGQLLAKPEASPSSPTEHSVWLGTTLILSTVICLLLPKRSDAHVRNDVNELAGSGSTLTNPARATNDYTEFALRAAQGRCMISYAVMSFAATVVFPATQSESIAFSPATNLHLGCVSLAAVLAAIWSTQKPAEYFSSYSIPWMTFTIGFGGVLFAGLIAAAIALPYRILDSAGPAHLSASQTQVVLVFRLLILPLFGWIASLCCAVIVRRFFH